MNRREYTGPIQNQVEEAMQFVLRNIRMGAEFSSLGRQDVYEIPVESIRELLLNAVIHRSYLEHGSIQVAIFDDRLEVTSPGKLPLGQSIERMKEGYSKIRNEAIAHVFSYMKMMEHWGSGIPRIIESVAKAGLQEPTFIDGDIDLRICIYRKNVAQETENVAQETGNVTQETENVAQNIENNIPNIPINEIIINEIRKNNKVTRDMIAKKIGVSKKTIERELKKMSNVHYRGRGSNGHWELEE